jgi:hypothetical protein
MGPYVTGKSTKNATRKSAQLSSSDLASAERIQARPKHVVEVIGKEHTFNGPKAGHL